MSRRHCRHPIYPKMQILLIRHAIAEDFEAFALTGRQDQDRPLTECGRKRMSKAARGIRRLVPALDLLVGSPLTRATETADLVAEAYAARNARPPQLTFDGLAPERSLDPVFAWIQAQPRDSVTALVGHEPELSLLLGRLLCGREQSWFHFKKGGACLLERETDSGFRLQWALTPAQLRALGVGVIE